MGRNVDCAAAGCFRSVLRKYEFVQMFDPSRCHKAGDDCELVIMFA